MNQEKNRDICSLSPATGRISTFRLLYDGPDYKYMIGLSEKELNKYFVYFHNERLLGCVMRSNAHEIMKPEMDKLVKDKSEYNMAISWSRIKHFFFDIDSPIVMEYIARDINKKWKTLHNELIDILIKFKDFEVQLNNKYLARIIIWVKFHKDLKRLKELKKELKMLWC